MRVYIFLFALFFSSCHNHSENEHLFTLPKEWSVSDSVSNKIKQRIQNGDVEYFVINETQFRFQKNPGSSGLYDIQVKQDNRWVTNLSMPMPKETFFIRYDFDLDNCFDLSFLEHGNINIHFFDKPNRRFISGSMQFSVDYALLDSNKLIYGANNHGGNEWDIDIFSIKNRTKTYLYKSRLFLKNNSNNGGFEITNGLVYKCRNGIETDTILINKPVINRQFSDFSLFQFMKDLAHDKAYR